MVLIKYSKSALFFIVEGTLLLYFILVTIILPQTLRWIIHKLIINVSRAYFRSCFVWQSQLFINGVPWLCSPRPWAERGAGSGHNREGKHSECSQSTYTFWAESTPPCSSSRNKNALLHVFLINAFHTPVVLHWGFSFHSVTRPWPPRVKCEGSVKVYIDVWHLKGLENPSDFKLPSSPTNYTYFQDFKFQKDLKKV